MIQLLNLGDNNPAIQSSPMINAAEKLIAYLIEHEEIGLTPSKAFKRNFVNWAAKSFEWPGYEEAELFAVNKVLNEQDFPPLEMLHYVLLKLKLIRHFKGACRLTKTGRELAGKPGAIFSVIAPFYLFRIDHAAYSRMDEPVLGNWDVFLNVLNVEAAHGVSGGDLREIFYGPPDPASPYDHMPGMIWSQILRPLCWLGLLADQRTERFQHFEERVYATTPLWRDAFDLQTDAIIPKPRLH